MPNKINIIFPVILNNTFARATSFAVRRLLAASVFPLQICITYCVMAVVSYFIAWLWQPRLETTEQKKDSIVLLRSLEKTVLFFLGGLLVYYLIMPLAIKFFLSFVLLTVAIGTMLFIKALVTTDVTYPILLSINFCLTAKNLRLNLCVYPKTASTFVDFILFKTSRLSTKSVARGFSIKSEFSLSSEAIMGP